MTFHSINAISLFMRSMYFSVEDCEILVLKGSLANYSTDYFWGHYVENLKEAE
ncbi:MAG: hypothetical protein PUA93_05310 [Eubacteriales bacterium]|nr:hypothetical protein [Eubacteriales bacterium]